jgi:hypothetical protein
MSSIGVILDTRQLYVHKVYKKENGLGIKANTCCVAVFVDLHQNSDSNNNHGNTSNYHLNANVKRPAGVFQITTRTATTTTTKQFM